MPHNEGPTGNLFVNELSVKSISNSNSSHNLITTFPNTNLINFADGVILGAGTTNGLIIGNGTDEPIGFYGVQSNQQYNTEGTTTGFTAGAGTAVLSDSTFTGNFGTRAYTIGDIVRALKKVGLMDSSP